MKSDALRIAAIGACAAIIGFLVTLGAERMRSPDPVEHLIELTVNGAKPTEIDLRVGDSALFATNDGKYHIIRQVFGEDLLSHNHSNMGYTSGIFGPGEAYEVRFLKPGSFNFHDHLNPSTTVRIRATGKSNQ